MQIFVGVPLTGGIKQEQGNQTRQFSVPLLLPKWRCQSLEGLTRGIWHIDFDTHTHNSLL